MRYYHEASASVRKAAVVQNPALGPENRLVGVEIVGGKATLFSPKGPFSMDELELVTAVGESLPLDQLLPGKPREDRRVMEDSGRYDRVAPGAGGDHVEFGADGAQRGDARACVV